MLTRIFAPYPWYKLVILALLSVNVLVFAIFHDPVSAVDSLCWVWLLVMFELETVSDSSVCSTTQTRRWIRNALIVVVLAVFGLYVQNNDWLDVCNAMFWFALIALLELELRCPQTVSAYSRSYRLVTLAVFTALLVMVAFWVARAAWLDAYDALLWIVAFAVIDVDIFKFLQLKSG